MNNAEFQLRGVGDPRLAVHATSALPAWLWSTDGTRIVWANPVGAKLFGAANGASLAKKMFGPADAHRRQVAQLAGRLSPSGAMRLERLRGFGAPLGQLVTCGCARLDFADGSHGILITAAEPVGRAMPLLERLQRLVEGIDTPIAAFARDGMFVGASDAARTLLGFRNLSEAGLDAARSDALSQGRAETPIGIGHMVLQRVGTGTDVGLVALIAPAPAPIEEAVPASDETAEIAPTPLPVTPLPAAPTADPPIPDYEQPAISGEAPAEFALIDEFAEPPEQPCVEPAVANEPAVADEPAEPDVETVLQLDMPHVETPHAETAAQSAPADDADRHEPSPQEPSPQEPAPQEPSPQEPAPQEPSPQEPAPFVEAVADEPSPPPPPVAEPAPAIGAGAPSLVPPPVWTPSWLDEHGANTRRHPLRFMWQMDAEERFALGSDEFTRLIGARTAAGFGRLWSEIADVFGLDPDGRVLKAVATRDTWSGITLNWPVDGGGRLPVEMSGLPIYDRARNFAGYRGFGVCRDLDGLARLAALRRYELFSDAPPTLAPPPPDIVEPDVAPGPPAVDPPHAGEVASEASTPEQSTPVSPASIASETSPPTDLETPVETPNEAKNVLPFRPPGEQKSPVLTPVENSAFNELARQLAARLESENGAPDAPAPPTEAPEPVIAEQEQTPEADEKPGWLARPEPPARGEARRDKMLLDLLPVGVLIYRLDRLLYANPAFLARIAYPSLHALEQAGGLDALYVEPGVSSASSTSDTGTPVTISASHAPPDAASGTEARLYTISWDEDSALALICSAEGTKTAEIAAAMSAPAAAPEPSPVGHANAEELGAILDTTAEGIVMFDAEGSLNSCNRSAEALFGYDGEELVKRNLSDLFAPESQRVVKDYLESINGSGVASLLEHGREVLGRVREGGLIPLSMTMGRTRPHGPNFFAVFRDLSQAKKSESELREARRLADRAANAKGDMLARISHEVRTPLNAIIGFSEVMIGERFGALGNERYVEYMKDIRASGERVIAIINDLLDLSRIETGKLDLAFANQNLNDLVESCVAVMQPQANRERIIIRTSLAHMLPPVVADARALRQITLNLIGNSIHLANAGGQVIVSTALSDFGDVVLRVRDTGLGLNDNEVAAAMEPYRTHAPSDQASDSAAVSLSLTKALVEANRAQFHIKTGAHSGTLVEVVFSHAMARA
jgi:PAS domain S-box-containing protein